MSVADFHRRWAPLGAPQRPAPIVVAAMQALAGDAPGLTLQLGVTPEIALIPRRSIAIDWNARMVAMAWPGGSADHRVVLGDWKTLPIADASMDQVIGDGSLTMLRWPDDYETVLDGLARVLRPGGRIVLRCFATPEDGETIAGVTADALARRVPSFAAFKLRFNMAVAREGGDPNPSGIMIHAAFAQAFPDRAALAAAAGWARAAIDEIDLYVGSAAVHSYPTRSDLAALARARIGPARFIEQEGYALASHCPLILIERAGHAPA